MQLIEVTEEEFDKLYIMERLSDNMMEDFVSSKDCCYQTKEKVLCIKSNNIKIYKRLIRIMILKELLDYIYVCLVDNRVEDRIEIKNIIKRYELEYIDRREE